MAHVNYQRTAFYFITIFLGLAALTLAVHSKAEVYRWVDEQGKTHYSDKKPKVEAEDITNEVKKQNIDTSSAEQRKLQEIFRPENDADREHYRRQQLQNQPSAEHLKHCNERRNYLHEISGRVQFIDDQGNAMKVTEKQRQERVNQVQQYLEENCS